jgi:hypothetical protein
MGKAILLLLLFFQTVAGFAQADNYTFHTVYVYNFIKNTEWPAGKQSVVIGIMGDSKHAKEAFEKMTAQKTNEALKLSVKTIKTAADLNDIHVLFIPSHEKTDLIKDTKGKHILVVTEDAEIKGAAINFLLVDSKLKFKINQDIISEAGLKVSNSLLALSK